MRMPSLSESSLVTSPSITQSGRQRSATRKASEPSKEISQQATRHRSTVIRNPHCNPSERGPGRWDRNGHQRAGGKKPPRPSVPLHETLHFVSSRDGKRTSFCGTWRHVLRGTSSSLVDRDLRSEMKAGTGNLLSMTRCLNTSDQTQRCLVADENRFDVYERVRDLGPVKFVGAYHSKCEDIFHTTRLITRSKTPSGSNVNPGLGRYDMIEEVEMESGTRPFMFEKVGKGSPKSKQRKSDKSLDIERVRGVVE